MRLLAFLGGILTIGAVTAYAQQTSDDAGEALQRSLEENAIRIPADDLAAALSAREDERSDRARPVRRLTF